MAGTVSLVEDDDIALADNLALEMACSGSVAGIAADGLALESV